MAFFPLFFFLLLLCFPVGCCFVAPLEEKELLRRKWLLLLWGSVEAGLKRSCWIVERIWWCWEEADDASPGGGQEGGGVLPNGGGREQRERLPFFSSPLFSSFNCHFLSFKTFPPLLVFQPSLLFSKTLPPFPWLINCEQYS